MPARVYLPKGRSYRLQFWDCFDITNSLMQHYSNASHATAWTQRTPATEGARQRHCIGRVCGDGNRSGSGGHSDGDDSGDGVRDALRWRRHCGGDIVAAAIAAATLWRRRLRRRHCGGGDCGGGDCGRRRLPQQGGWRRRGWRRRGLRAIAQIWQWVKKNSNKDFNPV